MFLFRKINNNTKHLCKENRIIIYISTRTVYHGAVTVGPCNSAHSSNTREDVGSNGGRKDRVVTIVSPRCFPEGNGGMESSETLAVEVHNHQEEVESVSRGRKDVSVAAK